jgi:hypothetical protein
MSENNEASKREWVSPAFERQDLKSALAGVTTPSSDLSGYS